MSKRVIRIRQHENFLQLTWVINNICTNHCDYCPPILHNGTNHNYDIERAKDFINRLSKHYEKIHCSISGGEPTVSPFFPEIVSMFYDKGHSVGLTTNGVRNVGYWEEIAPKLSYICFSYHPSHDDPHLIEKAVAAAKHTLVTVRVMMDSRYWDKAQEFYEQCSKIRTLRTEPVRILPEIANRRIADDYTPEHDAWFATHQVGVHRKDDIEIKANPGYRVERLGSSFHYSDGSIDKRGLGNDLITSGQNDFRGWACNIGLESLYIGFDGYVLKGNCGQGGYLFHIDNHANSELPTLGEICVQRTCFCVTDVLVSKAAMLDPGSDIIQKRSTGVEVKSDNDYKEFYKDYIKIKKV